MKKKFFIIFIVFITILIYITNSYWKIEYHISFFDFFTKSNELTLDEKNWLKKHGTILYAADNNSPPLRYYENDVYKGIVIDYLNELSKEINYKIDTKPMIWNDALISLKNGETDLCDMFTSKDRAKNYLFTDPIYYERAIIVTNSKNSSIKNEKDILNLKIGVQNGDYAIEYLNNKYKNIDFVFTTDYEESINLLKENKVDVIIGDEPVLTYFIEKLKLKSSLRVADTPLYKKESVFGIPKSEKTLQSIMNKGIAKLKRKNTIIKIQQNWFGISTPISENNYSQKLNLLILFFLTNVAFILLIFISSNISLKKEVEKRTLELSISRNDLQTTFDGLTSLMVVIDEKYIIKNCNKSFCEYFKSNFNNIEGKICTQFLKKFAIDIKNNSLLNILSKDDSKKMETHFNNFYYEVNFYPLSSDLKKSKRLLIMIKDVTKSKINSEKLIQNNKMTAIGHLSAGIAHEIRNPLGLIRNYNYLLKQSNSISNNNTIFNNIDKAIDKASNIIDNLLNFSRISSKEFELINLNNFIENILTLSSSSFKKKNIQINLICSKSLNHFIDPISLEHIFLNIINNSIDAIEYNGKITIVCKLIKDNLLIKLIDNGSGIDKENLKNLFDPFYTTKAPGKGTGLGLYITYNEIKKMNGDIKVKSNKNIGTTIDLILPERSK
ncbi:transporter substrate-binding domain-containing protein [Helicovermis profundi]|uniref:histidine kinase n=1 Tax=Helicovermis profundi TaxID=3065157 RepID=A0AAU9E2S2_9FIRM|nr:transporter substrate-binding domain-containing protein [Clostridia bacterium S502]